MQLSDVTITLDVQLIELLYAGICSQPEEDDLYTVWRIRVGKYINQTITILIPPDHLMRVELESYLPYEYYDALDEGYGED